MLRVGDRVRVSKIATRHLNQGYPWQIDYRSTLGKTGRLVYINTPRTSFIVHFPNGEDIVYGEEELELDI